jgi:HAD superfamily hydrolase (TIGR01509 family)
MARAVCFDVDGTLVDTVMLHARAWQEALARFGHRVAVEEVHAQIGKGGDQLLPVFLSEEDLADHGAELEAWRKERYARSYLPLVRPLPGARALVARCHVAGLRVGLATSSARSELERCVEVVGLEGFLDAVVTGDDADRSKPHPDLFEACLDRLGVLAPDAVAVGDSPYDAIAAARAGVRTVGLLSGGFPRAALEAAGCVAVHAGPAELLAAFDASPLAPDAGGAYAGA